MRVLVVESVFVADDADDAFDLDLAIAGLQASGTDVGIMLKVLARQLGETLGPRLSVERRGGLLRRSEEIRSLQIELGGDQYRVELDGGTVRCTVGHSSGGIRIRSEQLTIEEWLKRLLRSLKAEAEASESARIALERIMIGGRS